MRLLILGGTRFVGRAVVDEALAQGHEITVVTRGSTMLDNVEHVVADRNDGLHELRGRTWDATVDVCAYRPGQVAAAARALGDRAGTYCLISTVSVYASDIPELADESATLCDTTVVSENPDDIDITAQTYGPLKVLCEQQTQELFPRPLIIRPTYVIGPRDYTQRFPTWVRRIAESDVVECPGPIDAAMQFIDARDQAAFVVRLLMQSVSGTFHCAAPATTFSAMLTGIRDALQSDAELRWLDADACAGREADFPLWSSGESTPMLNLDATSAAHAGLRVRPFAQTVLDTRAWQIAEQT